MKNINFQFTNRGTKIEGKGEEGSFAKMQEKLSTVTLNNLISVAKLIENATGETMRWTKIRRVRVSQGYISRFTNKKKITNHAWNVLIEGRTAAGDVIYFHRRETGHRAAGQTLLYANNNSKPIYVHTFLNGEYKEVAAKWARHVGLHNLAGWLFITA